MDVLRELGILAPTSRRRARFLRSEVVFSGAISRQTLNVPVAAARWRPSLKPELRSDL